MAERTWPLLLAIAVLVPFLVLMSWALGRLRRQMKRPTKPISGPTWTVEQLRSLHESGQLTDKQYQELRDGVLRDLKRDKSRSRLGK